MERMGGREGGGVGVTKISKFLGLSLQFKVRAM